MTGWRPTVGEMRRFLIALAVAVALAALGAGKLVGASRTDAATVERVVDGDTYAKAASAENQKLVQGERVKLESDAEARDRYGRLLAYVYRERDGLFVNAELVRRGYARVLTIPPNVAHAAEFRLQATAARRAGRGLWSHC